MPTQAQTVSPAQGDVRRRSRPAVLRRLTLKGQIAVAVLGTLALTAAAAPLLTPYGPLTMAPASAFEGPSGAHWFGTDQFGRDLQSRVIYGARVSVGSAAIVVVVAGAIGVSLGLAAGYYGGIADAIIMRFIDTILAFPALLLAMGLIAILGQSSTNAIIAVIIVSIPAFARLVRATTLQQKALDYVEASRSLGATDGRIMRTIFPSCLPPLLVQIAINASWAVLTEAALSFLGLGTRPPTPSWGQMLNDSRNYLYDAPWYGVFPGVFLTVLVLSLNTLADTLQHALSPE